ncbi:hypothetical protein CIPAW_09G196200 [Carya illinoinensis]|uniref:Uncharacterized protein n=2 Tax=Carya illinoinensis TaxID=32201 RepID=A0A8T1PMB0_CARIL|nr:hypothetical protein CIPAW_09G196200 [Carya illinoinensis]KAG6643239.1 hypothetical protein CIPAW_09G196200 [Carya illinoinensis]
MMGCCFSTVVHGTMKNERKKGIRPEGHFLSCVSVRLRAVHREQRGREGQRAMQMRKGVATHTTFILYGVGIARVQTQDLNSTLRELVIGN